MKAEALYIKIDKTTKNGVTETHLFPSDTDFVCIKSYTNSRKREGGAPSISASFYFSRPLDKEWSREEYVEFDGEKYYATSIPSSSKDGTSGLYKHEASFTSKREVLDNTLFFDVVSQKPNDTNGGDKYRSNQTKFSFGGNINEFVSRINDSMAYCGLYDKNGVDGYCIVVDEGYGTDEIKELSFESQYLSAVIQLIKTTFELDYYWVGKICHIGSVQHDLSTSGNYGSRYVLQYGSDAALMSIQRSNTNNKAIDVITGCGSSDNIPYYYPNEDEFGTAKYNIENANGSTIKNISIEKLNKWASSDIYNKPFILFDVAEGSADINTSAYSIEKGIVVKSDTQQNPGQTMGNNTIADETFVPTLQHSGLFGYFLTKYYDPNVDFTSFGYIVSNGSSTPANIKNVKTNYVFPMHISIEGHAGSILDMSKFEVSAFLYTLDGMRSGGSILSWESSSVIKTVSIHSDAVSPYPLKDKAGNPIKKYMFPYDGDYTIDITIEISINFQLSASVSANPSIWRAINSYERKFTFTGSGLNYTLKSEGSGLYMTCGEELKCEYENCGITFADVEKVLKAKARWIYVTQDNGKGKWVLEKDPNSNENTATKVYITGRKWITPSTNLMPSIYRKSEGADRFYYATNTPSDDQREIYTIPGTNTLYHFNNLYKDKNPHQGYVTFDDIKPTIRGIRNDVIQKDGLGQLFCEIADVAFDKADSDAKDENGNFLHPYFYIKLHKFSGEFGFDLFKHALESESGKIEMIECHGCPACSFPIMCYWDKANNICYNPVSVDKNGNLKAVREDYQDYIMQESDIKSDTLNQNSQTKEIWIAVQKETSTLGVVMPNASAGLKPQKGDKFVITGIKAPLVLITAAERRLDEALIKHMSENNEDKFNYSVKFSRIFLQENTDFAAMLSENTKLTIKYNNELIDVFVSNYQVKIDDNVLTSVEVELVTSLEVGQNDIKQIVQSVEGEVVRSLGNIPTGGSGFNAAIADKMYLSKVKKDTAQEPINFEKGLTFGNGAYRVTPEGVAIFKGLISQIFKSGALGSGFKLGDYNGSGDSYLEVDRLLVRKAAEFVRLVIRELQSVGGEIVLSPAAMKISNVVYFEKGVYLPEYEALPLRYNVYRCYFSQKKGDEEIENQFVEGDLVRCQTFNVKEGVSENVKNRYYWRKVYKVGKDFIDVLADFCDTGSDIPQAGDELVQMGNTTDTARQSVVVLSAYGADAPSLKMYEGVDSYSLENKEVFVLSRQEMFAIADKFRFVTRKANGEIESTQSFAELVMSVDGLRTTVNRNKEELDGEIKSTQSQIIQTANDIRTEVRRDYSTKKDVNDQIAAVSSSITQTATQIAMKVGYTLAERRNLLVGSLFRKQGEGFFLLRSKIYRTSAHEGANVIFAPEAKAGGVQWGGAANSRNIHVTKGKTYTLAFWARTKSGKVEIVGETIWHSSATDTSRPGGYTGPNGSAYLGGATITPSDGWYLYQKTFTVAANAPYEWISVACLKVNASTASQQAYIAHPILIEGTAKDLVCWSASPNDYNYIGGNLLDNTRTFTKVGNLMRLDASIVTNESYNNGCSVIYAYGASGYVEMAQWSVNTIIKKDEDYIFSFMAKGSGNLDAYMYSGTNLSIFAEDSERDTTTSNADGGRRFSLTSEWKRYWVHWRSEGIGIPNLVLIRCLQGGKAWVTMPKLEVGATPTDWIEGKSGFIEDSGIAAKLLRTGLDIENGKITATADRFEIRNNSGETTASVNEKGEFETYSGLFSGFVRKRLTTITLNNIDKYLSKKKPIQNGYVTLDFVAAGSYIELSGNFGSKLGSAYPVVTLPFYQPANTAWKALVSDSLIGEAFTPKGAAAYLGQTFIIRNNTSGSPTTTINLVGYTSLVGGKDISKPYWLERGWMAILTCEFVYVPANRTYSIVWNGYNVPFESPTAQSDDGKPVNDGGEQEAMSDDPTTEEEQSKE